jgi:hypothetical protein
MLPSVVSSLGAFAVPINGAIDLVVKRIRTKACQRCGKNDDTLYRIRLDESRLWVFVCLDCLELVKPGNRHYQYGGTWKSKKRH